MQIMKKKIIPAFALAMLTMASCQTSKNTAMLSPADFEGEWNIVEVNGSAITLKESPYIGFDIEQERVYGNAGCNNIMGSFQLNKEKAGSLELGQMASTMMAGPNMDTERNVLNALGQVKSYQPMENGEIALCNDNDRPVVILKKRAESHKLNGEWNIIKVYDNNVPDNLEKQPFLAFDVAQKVMHGCAGCNNIHGSFVTDEGQKHTLAFQGVAATRMMCPDMELENNIMKALNQTQTYSVLDNGHLALYADGKQIMELVKK